MAYVQIRIGFASGDKGLVYNFGNGEDKTFMNEVRYALANKTYLNFTQKDGTVVIIGADALNRAFIYTQNYT
jgi:hypothetical protein